MSTTDTTDSDANYLEKELGYKQVLFRGLHGYQNFALCLSQVGIAPGICGFGYGFGLIAGGPSTIIWSFFAAWFCSFFIAQNLAEICATYPSCGSVYHWAAQLVPSKFAPLASYITGWLNLLANATSDAAMAFITAQFINAAMVAKGHEPYGERETVGVAIAFLAAWSIIACLRIDIIGHIGTFAGIIQIGCLIIIPITLLACCDDFRTGEWVFTEKSNYTGFEHQSYASAVGVVTIAIAFAGYDSAAHVSEETQDATKTAPRNIVLTVFCIGLGGLFLWLSLLFTTPSIDAVLSGPTAVPAVNLFVIVCGQKLGMGMTWLLLVTLVLNGFGCVTITGRIAYALSRDNLFPFSEWLAHMSPTIAAPVNCIFATFIFDSCILLLCLDKTNGLAAYYSIISLCSFGYFSSYVVPIVLKQLYFGTSFHDSECNLGVWSLPSAAIATIWLGGVICLTFLPSFYPVTKANMNWLVVVVFGSAFLIGANWIITGRYNFHGPVRGKSAYGYKSVDSDEKNTVVADETGESGKLAVTAVTELGRM